MCGEIQRVGKSGDILGIKGGLMSFKRCRSCGGIGSRGQVWEHDIEELSIIHGEIHLIHEEGCFGCKDEGVELTGILLTGDDDVREVGGGKRYIQKVKGPTEGLGPWESLSRN